MSTNSLFAQANVLHTDENAQSYNIEATGNLSKNVYWNFQNLFNVGFEPGQRPVKRETFASLSQQFSFNFLPQGSYTLQVRDQALDNGNRVTTYSNSLSAQILGASFTNDLDYQVSDTTDPTLIGSLTARRRIPLGNLRGRINYGLKNPAELINADLRLQSRISNDLTLNTQFTSNFIGNQENTLRLGLDKTFDKFRLGVTGSASDNSDYQFGFNVAYNFIPQSLSGDYKMTSDTSDLNTGSVFLRPFVDTNANDIFDPGEQSVEGLRFKNLLSGRKGEPSQDATIRVAGLKPNVVNRIKLDPSSYPDIYMEAEKPFISIYGKRGTNGPLDFPIDLLGEISGTLYYYNVNTDSLEPLPDTLIYLMSDSGDIVQQLYSEFDGYYTFSGVRAGTYQVYLPESDTLSVLNLTSNGGIGVTTTMDDLEAVGSDLIVTSKEIIPYDEFDDDMRMTAAPRFVQTVEKIGKFFSLKLGNIDI